MRAAGAEHRRTRHSLDGEFADLRLYAEEHLAQALGVELIEPADLLLADAGDAGGLDLILHKALELFDDVERLDL